MAATLDDVVAAINSMGSAQSAAQNPDSPEMIQRRVEGLNSENEALERQRALLDQRAASSERDQAIRQNAIEQARNEEQVMQAVYDAQMANTSASAESRRAALENLEDARAATDGLERQSAELDRNTQSREANNAAIQSMTNSVQNSMMAYQKHNVVNVANIVSMGKQIKEVGLLGAAQAAVTGLLLAFVDSVLAITMEVDKETSALMRNTGVTREHALAMVANRQAMAGLGVEVGELTAAHTALRGSMTDFSMMSVTQQRAIGETGALLAEQGVSLDDYAKGMQTSTKAFGMSAEASTAASRELNSLAANIGVLPKQMAADFANAGGQLAKFGSDGVRAFKDLAIVSKSTGLSIDKLLKITDKFDTFEGAAEQAGMLNAALGGNFVNAMDLMMTTDPAERFGMIKDAIMNTGLSFDEMSYYQKKFYAEAAGLDDVNDLALLMSGNMDKLTKSSKMSSAEIEDLAARTKEFQDIGEKFKNLFRKMIPHLEKAIVFFHDLMDTLSENETMIKDIAGTFETMGTVLKWVAENFKLVAYGIAGLGLLVLVGKLWLFVKALLGIGAAAPPVAAGIMGTVGPMLAFGAAVALVGAGIWMASEGIASMAKAFSGLDGAAMAAVGVALLAIGAGIYFLGGASAAASGPLLALAFSVMMIGAGIGLAAAGIGLMGEGFGKMFEHASVDQLQSFVLVLGTLALSIALLGSLGPVGYAGMSMLAGGFLAMGVAMMMMEGSLTAFAQFTGNLSSLAQDSSGLTQVASEIVAIADAINTLPLMPTLALSTAFEHARASATTGAHSAAANRTAAAAPANQPPPKVEVKVYIEDVEVKPSKIETALNDIITPLLN
jgi:hypothetical protein|tara:strand:+ start:8747 stop:11269 length:2523 start_codon:yes stop_codon:yes gene_type:complete